MQVYFASYANFDECESYAVAPDTRNLRLKGRLEGRKLVPYWSRAEIDRGRAPLAGRELAWVDDALDLFFLQIQGSGRIRLPDGSLLRVGYADQNGHPYRSVGRLLVERGELALEAASMQGIRDWARANPAKVPELLAENRRGRAGYPQPPAEGAPGGSQARTLLVTRRNRPGTPLRSCC
ncbi:MltA domain-containing protein [Mycobacterium tuberculosis]|uniref:MltA domain-containing protein n=1 Tax=Mycobacterium tuberculosis TaxID=1773 RepID=UPI0035106DF1